jgi:hypothetical protein
LLRPPSGENDAQPASRSTAAVEAARDERNLFILRRHRHRRQERRHMARARARAPGGLRRRPQWVRCFEGVVPGPPTGTSETGRTIEGKPQPSDRRAAPPKARRWAAGTLRTMRCRTHTFLDRAGLTRVYRPRLHRHERARTPSSGHARLRDGPSSLRGALWGLPADTAWRPPWRPEREAARRAESAARHEQVSRREGYQTVGLEHLIEDFRPCHSGKVKAAPFAGTDAAARRVPWARCRPMRHRRHGCPACASGAPGPR